MTGWAVERRRGSAPALHAASADMVAGRSGPLRRTITVLEPTGPAVVLGSAQAATVVDAARAVGAGVAIARRASGGGAVLVGPDEAAWVDVVIPAGDPLWADDVGRAMWWVGEEWRAAIETVSAGGGWEPAVWQGALVRTAWSGLVCFGGLGPGEVTIAKEVSSADEASSADEVALMRSGDRSGPGAGAARGRAKVVGISQRRTRSGALFQCAVLSRWRPADLLDVLALAGDERAEAAVELEPAGVGIGALAGAVADAFIGRLVARDGGCQDDPDGSA